MVNTLCALSFVVLLLLVLCPPATAGEGMHETALVSRAGGPDGAVGNQRSDLPSLSADGRFVAFVSRATNLHPDDTDELTDVYVRDLETHETLLVSRASGANGTKGNGASLQARISADGRSVAFISQATNLHPDDADGVQDVFVRDLQTHQTMLVSRASGPGGVKGNAVASAPLLSADGRFAAFVSQATNLHPDDTDTLADVFVRDLDTDETVLVSRASGASGVKGNGNALALFLAMSSDGRYVAFPSTATNLHPDDSDDLLDIFVRDLLDHETILGSRASGASGAKSNAASNLPLLSANGRYLAFSSEATNLHPDDSDTVLDAYLRDLETDQITLISRATGPNGAKANNEVRAWSISADGRFVVFSSTATNLHPDDTDDVQDVFIRNLEADQTILASRATGSDGVKGDGSSSFSSLSADGRYVAFDSSATNFHLDDDNESRDVFRRDLFAGGCAASGTTACLQQERFAVGVAWRGFDPDDEFELAQVSDLGTDQAAIFTFGNPSNLEFLIKVINGCSNNGHFWVFFAGATNVEFTVSVTDTVAGETKTYDNPLGNPADAVTDTRAFATCP